MYSRKNSCQTATSPRPHAGFTLLEMLVAMTILVTAFVIIWSTFSSTLTAWKRGTDVLSEIHHGDFVMDQLVSALRSTAFFATSPHLYDFKHEKGSSGGYPADTISWVTASSAFMPMDSPYADSLHRIVFTIDAAPGGDSAVSIRAFSHLSNEEDARPDPWFISSQVKGFRMRAYDVEDRAWLDRWEETNAIPSLVEITLYMDPVEEYGPPIRLLRAVEIPVAPAVTGVVDFAEGDAE